MIGIPRRASRSRTLLPLRRLLLAAALVFAGGCAADDEGTRDSGTPSGALPATPQPASTATPDAANGPPSPTTGAPVVVFLGDSLTAGFGLAEEQAFPALVEQRLVAAGTAIVAVNAGVSGDTSAGGLRRLDWLLRQRPDLLVVELGANDALRGQPVAGVEANLRAIVERSHAAGTRVLLVGLRIPPSYGADYADSFAGLYPRLARELDVPLVPFLLEGVAGRSELNLADGVHPNAEGHRRVAELVAPRVAAALAAAPTARAAGTAAGVRGAGSR